MSHSFKLKHGWKPELPDFRDFPYTKSDGVPPLVSDLSGLVLPGNNALASYPESYDQGNLGSCVGHGVVRVMALEMLIQKDPAPFAPSRLMAYYLARSFEGTTKSDDGAQIRDGMKGMVMYGAAPETLWPYVESKFAQKPVKSAYDAAKHMEALKYYSADNRNLLAMLARLGIDKKPIVGGITCYTSLESDTVAQTGILPMPQSHEKVIGGHCICLVGYDQHRKAFIAANSWGTHWGIHGHFYIPFAYVCNTSLSDDWWTVETSN